MKLDAVEANVLVEAVQVELDSLISDLINSFVLNENTHLY